MTKFGKQRSGVLCGFEGRECLIGSGPPDAHCVSIFGHVSSGTHGADGFAHDKSLEETMSSV